MPRRREGSQPVKIRVYYKCSQHYKAGDDPREAKKRAARKQKNYPSVTDVAMSGLFDSVFEDNGKKKILGRALGYERGDLVERPAEKIEAHGGKAPARECTERFEEPRGEREPTRHTEWPRAIEEERERPRRSIGRLGDPREASNPRDEAGPSTRRTPTVRERREQSERAALSTRASQRMEEAGPSHRTAHRTAHSARENREQSQRSGASMRPTERTVASGNVSRRTERVGIADKGKGRARDSDEGSEPGSPVAFDVDSETDKESEMRSNVGAVSHKGVGDS